VIEPRRASERRHSTKKPREVGATQGFSATERERGACVEEILL
jgi:hypothetical protein